MKTKIIEIITNIDGVCTIVSVSAFAETIEINGEIYNIPPKNLFSGVSYVHVRWDEKIPMRQWINSLPEREFHYADPILGIRPV